MLKNLVFLKESDNDTELQDLIFNDFSSDKPLTCTQTKLLITKMLLSWH
jgi:hypothetical protein